jgi:uncharacterized membrane protein YkvA (DUF1232 family)
MEYPRGAMTSGAFESTARRWLESFQQDLKDFLHVVCDDMELDDGLRASATAAVLYALAPGDVVPDSVGPLGFVDDALALRIVLDEIAERAPARFDAYRERLPDMIDALEDDIALARSFFDDTFDLFKARVLATVRIEFKGKRVPEALADPEWLDDEVTVAALKLDFKPSDVTSATKRLNTLPPLFRQKLVQKK